MKKKLMTFLMMALMFAVMAVPAYASCDDCIGSIEGYDWSEHCEVYCTCEWGPCGSCNDSGTYLEEFCGATHQYTYISTNGSHAAICACDYNFSEECTFTYKSTTPSTCQNAGYVVYECTVCKGIKTEALPIADHSYPMEPNRVYASTCTTAGYTEWICETCDHVKQTDWNDPLGHDWIESTIPAECDVDGQHFKVCDRCGKDESTVIPAPGHDWNTEPMHSTSTCYYAGTATYECLTCGEEKTQAAPKTTHKYIDGRCTMCGITENAETTAPSGGNLSGGSTGNTGKVPEELIGDDLGDPKRILGLFAIGTMLMLLVLVIRRRDE